MKGNWEILCGSTLVFKRVIVLYIIQSETMFVFWNCSKGGTFFGTHGIRISLTFMSCTVFGVRLKLLFAYKTKVLEHINNSSYLLIPCQHTLSSQIGILQHVDNHSVCVCFSSSLFFNHVMS